MKYWPLVFVALITSKQTTPAQGIRGKTVIVLSIGNELFAWYGSTHSKSRVNFLDLLHRPYKTYTITEDTLAYLEEHKYPKKWQRILRRYIGITFISKDAWEGFMDDHGLTGADHRRQASEALIYASLIHHGFSHNMTIFSDGVLPSLLFLIMHSAGSMQNAIYTR